MTPMKALYGRDWDLPFDKLLSNLNSDFKIEATKSFIEERNDAQ